MGGDEDAVAPADLRAAPARDGLAVLCDALAPGGRAGRVRRLPGGVSAGTHAVELLAPDGGRRWVVLRRYGDEHLARDPDCGEREWRLLRLLERHGVPAARPLWRDAAGAVFGRPALVTTRLPGRPVLAPRDVAAWTRGLAQALAAVHRSPFGTETLAFLPDQGAGLDRALAGAPPAADLAHPLGAAVWAALRRCWPRARREERRLVHGDYWPGNTVWRRGRLGGVVDWEGARRGDPAQDVGCCRFDLTLLAGPAAADAFLAAYVAAAGPVPHLGIWELHVVTLGALSELEHWLAGYRDLGRTDLTLGALEARRDAFLAGALTRAG